MNEYGWPQISTTAAPSGPGLDFHGAWARKVCTSRSVNGRPSTRFGDATVRSGSVASRARAGAPTTISLRVGNAITDGVCTEPAASASIATRPLTTAETDV